MVKAIWNNVVVAESPKYPDVFAEKPLNEEVMDGLVYFPPELVKWDYLTPSDIKHTDSSTGSSRTDERGERVPLTIADSKGEVTYYNIKVREKLKRNAAWSYVEPLDEAKHIKGYVTFDKVVVRLEL